MMRRLQSKPKAKDEKIENFLRAAETGQLSLMKSFIESGVISLEVKNEFGLNALQLAARNGHKDVVRELLKFGADPNAATNQTANFDVYRHPKGGHRYVEAGYTALHFAVANGHENIVPILLEFGSDSNYKVIKDNVKIIKNEYGLTVYKDCCTVLTLAAEGGNIKILTLLLENGANPNITDEIGNSPLHVAAVNGNKKMVALLVALGADRTIRNNEQKTALQVASDLECKRLLEKTQAHAWQWLIEFELAFHVVAAFDSWQALETQLHNHRGVIASTVGVATGDNLLHQLVRQQEEKDGDLLFLVLKEVPCLANGVNSDGDSPLQLLLEDAEADIDATASVAAFTSEKLITSSATSGAYSRETLQFLHRTLQRGGDEATNCMHLHVCGNGCAGKSTLVSSLLLALKQESFWQRNNPFRERRVSININDRTVGQVQETVRSGGTQWIIHDYGGQEEFHVNHPAFLAMPNSVYVMMVAVYDVENQKPYTLEVICSRYKYWLRFINSVVEEGDIAPVVTLINKHALVSAEFVVDVTTELVAIAEVFSAVEGSRLEIVDKPMLVNVKSIEETRAFYDTMIAPGLSGDWYTPRVEQSALLKDVLLRKQQWPPIVPFSSIQEKYLLPCTFAMSNLHAHEADVCTEALDLVGSSVLNELIFLGEVVVVSNQWVVTDVDWLTRELLGQIIRTFGMNGKDGAHSLRAEQLTLAQINQATQALKATWNLKGAGETFIADLLVALGLCIPSVGDDASSKLWFPVFTRQKATPEQCQRMVLVRDGPGAGRCIIRRFHVYDATSQMFPPGYFSKLFVDIAAKYHEFRDQIFVYEDAFVLTFKTRVMTVQVLVKIGDVSHTAFELSVSCTYKAHETITTPSQAWIEFSRLRDVIMNSRNWMRNVPIREVFVNPDSGASLSEEELYKQVNSTNPIIRDQCLAYIYGVDHEGYLVDESLTTKEINNTQLVRLMKQLQHRVEGLESSTADLKLRLDSVERTLQSLDIAVLEGVKATQAKTEAATDLAFIRASAYTAAFYQALRWRLNATYVACSCICTEMVRSETTVGVLGSLGNLLNAASTFTPLVGIGVAFVGQVLMGVDEAQQNERVRNYATTIAADSLEMAALAEEVARKVALVIGSLEIKKKRLVNLDALSSMLGVTADMVSAVAQKGVKGLVASGALALKKKLQSDEMGASDRADDESTAVGERHADIVGLFLIDQISRGSFRGEREGRAEKMVAAVCQEYKTK